ncbi:MAG: T9SS type A sorting domain-containing protein, partial [Bacteroidota bacterium]
NGSVAFAATDEGIFRSTDLGSSWTKIRTNTLYVELSYSIISAKGNIYVANSNGGVNSGKDSIYKSTDNGDTWVKINNNLPAFLYGRTLTGYGDTLFIGQVGGVYRSLNGGQSWQIDTIGLGTNAGILSSSISGNVITMGTSKGIAVSTNNGNNWTMLSSNMYNGDVMGFVQVGERLLVSMNGTNDKGIYISLNRGSTWTKSAPVMAPNSTQTYISLMFEKKGALFGTVAFGGVYASFDTGATWKTVNTGLSATATVNGFYTDADTIYGCMKEGLFRTTNNGTSWVNWGNTGFPAGAVSSMTIIKDTMYVSNGTTKLYLSGNRGRSWITKTVTLAAGQLMLHKNRLMTMTGGKLYWSPDTGTTWPEVNTAFSSNVQSVLSLNNNMFVRVSSKGMYMSTNSGTTWSLTNQGLPTSSPTLTFLASAWDTLYAGFSNGGILRRGLSELGITHVKEIHSGVIPKDISLSQNYPNPFNPSTKIDFTLSQNGSVSLKVYDAVGREVATIVQGQMNAGTYSAEFNGANLSSGVYFYRLMSGAQVSMKKMIMLK